MVAEECSTCAIPLGELEPSGRFVPLLLTVWVIVILICSALALDNMVAPTLWVHVALWAPLTIALELFALRAYRTHGVYRAYERQRTAFVQSEPR